MLNFFLKSQFNQKIPMKIRCLLYLQDDLWVLEPLRPAIGTLKYFRAAKDAYAWAKDHNIKVVPT